MGNIQSLGDYSAYTEKLNIDTLRESEPSTLYHFIPNLTEKEADLMRKAYYTDLKKSVMDWREKENTFALNRLMKMGMIKSYIDDKGKTFKFTRLGKKIAKLLVEDYFPFDNYPTQQRAITPGRIYRSFYIKTYFNRRPVTTNSIPTQKIGSYEFQTRMIEFEDVVIVDDEVGKVQENIFKENKAAKILKEKVEKGLKAFENNKNTRILRPFLYNRRTDEIIFMAAFGGQGVYIRSNNVNIAYLRHKYGENIKFLINTNHLNKILSIDRNVPPLPVMVLNEANEPVAILGNDTYLIKEKSQIKEIINSFHRSHEIEEEN